LTKTKGLSGGAARAKCRGECPKNRLPRMPDGEPGLNYLCPGLKRFFAHAVPTAAKMAAQLRPVPPSPPRRMR